MFMIAFKNFRLNISFLKIVFLKSNFYISNACNTLKFILEYQSVTFQNIAPLMAVLKLLKLKNPKKNKSLE